MKSLLNALQEGRLIELPDSDKERSLEYLAHMIEAVPDLAGSPELAEEMIERERQHNTGLGLGVACPHVRASGGGELLCAVGWSPQGIDYDAADGRKVHLVVMYYIPDAEKNVYLKEVSALAGAIRREGGIQPIASAEDIATVRERLLDWVQAAIDANIPEAKARMIRLEARQAVAEGGPPVPAEGALQLMTALFVVSDGKAVALCPSAELSAELEKDAELASVLARRGQFERGGWRFVFRAATVYGARVLYDFTAVK
ncbi:MAG: PTS sugar transporter subunit IIA [Elusimicrobia bacterium]|nr:PTS sugar transporter subunit IIA [Elusimicrobiota bacterium]